MGLYDRDYERERRYDDGPGFHLTGPTSMTTKLMIVMGVIFVLQLLTRKPNNWVTETFSLHADLLVRPWQVYQLVTYGFLHDPFDFWHIILNMLGLFFFGRMVEERYGTREFLTFFLAAIVFAALVWLLGELAATRSIASPATMIGASGAIAAVLILFALNYPHQQVLFMFIIPMPMWVLAVIIVVYDAFGAIKRSGNVAFTAHLGGAAFAYLYFRWGGRLANWLPSENAWKRLKPGPKLRVHDPEKEDELDRRVNEILTKINDHGEASLTRSERKFMQKASQEYQKRRR
jgi:membrane associated rhomboid family serine protease